MATRKELADAIQQEEQRLADLRREIDARSRLLNALQEELAALSAEERRIRTGAETNQRASLSLSNEEKISLFRSLFRGREDVFPRRWDNPKTGKSGYSPTCANEWQYGLCEKKKAQAGARRLTCGDCPNQAFLPITNEAIVSHLRGQHVIGVYPLLSDETCWFLAADFDKKSWQEDIGAFAETCKANGVPVAIERSRSGNGAHAWFFFSAPLLAMVARKMACFLITETMANRHQLSMDSYDRLFPNQDTMPKGGFGNLIALPLQGEARKVGNSIFVDSSFTPFADQWKFLSNHPRIAFQLVHGLAETATRNGRVIGVSMADFTEEIECTPWDRPPSGKPKPLKTNEPLPAKVCAVLSQRLFVEKEHLPNPLLNRIKRLAAFQNPEFYKKQKMRLSTALTPRVIACFEELEKHIALPRGCLPDLQSLLDEVGVSLAVDDKREVGKPLDFRFRGELTPTQEQAAKEMLAHDMGVFVAPPGSGKTVLGAYLIAQRGRNALVMVHRKPLLDQWRALLSLFLGIEPKNIGQVGAGKRKPNGDIDVAMIQSLVHRGQVDDLVTGYGHVIVDECHHSPAVSFERVLAEAKARYITGLTATPQRRDGHHPIIRMQLGPIRFAIDPKAQNARRPFDLKLILRETGFQLELLQEVKSIQELYSLLVVDQARNELILNDVIQSLEEKRAPILLTERRDHLEFFAERLNKCTRNLIVFYGGMKAKECREALRQLASIPDREERLILATGRYIGEGFDDPRLDTLFLALPVSWKGTLVQYTGRLHRLHPGKKEVRIYDYADSRVPMLLKMLERRLQGYRAIGYIRDMDVLDQRVPGNKIVIEYDDETSFDQEE